MLFGLFKHKEKLTDTQPVFRDDAFVDVTYFDERETEDTVGYFCGANIRLSPDGHLVLYSLAEKRVLEDISITDIIKGSNNINNYDPDYINVVSLTTEKIGIRISLKNGAAKRDFWNALTSTYDDIRAQS